MTGTRGGRRRMVGMGLAVGVGLLVGTLADPGQGLAQMPAPSAGMPGPSASAQPRAQVTPPGFRSFGGTTDPGRSVERHWRHDGDRDRHHGWDRHRPYRPYWGHYGPYYPYYSYYPRYGYAYPGPYGTYPGRWVWDGWNWVFVPLY